MFRRLYRAIRLWVRIKLGIVKQGAYQRIVWRSEFADYWEEIEL